MWSPTRRSLRVKPRSFAPHSVFACEVVTRLCASTSRVLRERQQRWDTHESSLVTSAAASEPGCGAAASSQLQRRGKGTFSPRGTRRLQAADGPRRRPSVHHAPEDGALRLFLSLAVAHFKPYFDKMVTTN